MEKITLKDNRTNAIRKFDGCMERFFSEAKSFVTQLKNIRDSDEDKLKIYTLSLNFHGDTLLIAENCMNYSPYISNSLLSIRLKWHNELYRRLQEETVELKTICMGIITAGSIGLNNWADNTTAVMLVDNQLSELKDSISLLLKDRCVDIFEGIVENIKIVEREIFKLMHLGNTRTDSIYEDIYLYSWNSYFSSDEWAKVRDNYIKRLFKTDFRYKQPDAEAILRLQSRLYYDLSNDENVGAIWEGYSENKTMMARKIIEKDFETDIEVSHLFYTLGRINLLDEWHDDIRFAEMPFEDAFEEFDVRNTVVFIDPWTEEKFRGVWNDIYQYMMKNKDSALDWCCLQHTMTYYNMIEDCKFNYFMKWLNDFSGKALISDVNIRQLSNQYFAKATKRMWNLNEVIHGVNEEDFVWVGKDTNQVRTKFNKYCRMCAEIKKILLDYHSSHR